MNIILANALAELPDDERERRIAWCHEHEQYGITVEREPGGILAFYWAGELLTTLDQRAFRQGMSTPAELS